MKVMQTVRSWITLPMVALVIAMASHAASAAEPLVDVAWVKNNINKPGIVFIDARPATDFLRGHIPGAVNTNYGKSGWRETRDGIPGLFPKDPSNLAKHIGELGIDNDTQVVLVAPGGSSSDMGIATRMYWTFKVLGHDNVSVLNGGMNAYLAEVDAKKNPVNPLEKGAAKPTAKSFAVNLRQDMLVGADDVKAAAGSGVALVDNRTADQYMGVNRHPKSKASGTIPGAINISQSWMTENGGGTFRDKETLNKLFKAAGVPTEGGQISFCNTGHWASVGWFAASEILGNKDAKMYDGSMVEWTAGKNDTEQKVKF